jgi:hypothetical protein
VWTDKSEQSVGGTAGMIVLVSHMKLTITRTDTSVTSHVFSMHIATSAKAAHTVDDSLPVVASNAVDVMSALNVAFKHW